jgi:hypothetical protein
MDLAVELAAWMLVEPPPHPAVVRLTVPPNVRSLHPELAIVTGMEIEPGNPNEPESRSRASHRGSGQPVYAGRRPEADVLAEGRIAIAMATWRNGAWRFDPAMQAWADHLMHVMTSRWTGVPASCDCCASKKS